jgi:hypothetical protein
MANAANYRKGNPPQPTGIVTRERTAYLAGAAAGNVTLTGIKVNEDFLKSVTSVVLATGVGTDLTSEFNIIANDTIDNTGGTSSAGAQLIVVWYDADYGEKTAVMRN